ncbi:MAG TPA: ferritin-like domain-containing protein [Gemmatimonadaceae bacterium]|nr:ferritin-like domain-containing protein [Gemmatimonadaceae bacterium]
MSEHEVGGNPQSDSNRSAGSRTRRNFLRTVGAGGAAVLIPGLFASCDDIINVPLPPAGAGGNNNPGTPAPVTNLSFDLRTDVGIFRLVHSLEQLEGAFYTAVVANASFASFFNAEEREILTDIRDAEVIHREFFRTALGNQAVPDLRGSINTATLNSILSSKTSILAAARNFEHTGVAGLNGAGKYLQDARNLLVAGKLASVEARHAAALRDISPPSGTNANTAFAGDDIIDATGRDVKLEAGAVIARVVATNLLIAGTLAAQPISNGPTATQGVPTPDFFPANP